MGIFATTVLVYFPGLSGEFVFDDQYNLMLGHQLQVQELDLNSLRAAAFSGEAGPLKRPISMLSFALNYYFAGSFSPMNFKIVNLGIHLLCGAALYIFLTLLLAGLERHRGATSAPIQREYFILAVTGAWLLHPLALTSVLYVVQRMNSLATLFTLWGLILYLRGRTHLQEGRDTKGLILMAGGVVGFGVLASLSKENGVLMPFYALVVEAVLYRFRGLLPSARKKLFAFFSVTALLPLLIAIFYIVIHPEWVLRPYLIRTFTLSERLMTESRVLWEYIKWIIAPSNIELGLFHDDIPISTGILQPLTTFFAIVGLVLLSVAAYLVRNRAPLVAFGILWFFVGHSLESSILALEIAHEHRNYLPMVGILAAIFYMLFAIGNRPRLAQIPVAASMVVMILFSIVTVSRATAWSNNTILYLTDVKHHPDSARLNYEAGRQYVLHFERDKTNQELYDKAKHYLLRTAELDSRSTTGLIGMIFLSHFDGHKVDPPILSELQRRLEVSFISAFDLVSLDRLAGAQGKEPPILPHKDVSELFDAVLRNPTLNPITHGMVLSILSSYYANQRHSMPDATLLARKAIEVAPNEATFNVSFSNLLLALHKYDAAREQLNIARSKDRLGLFADKIAANEKIIEQHGQ